MYFAAGALLLLAAGLVRADFASGTGTGVSVSVSVSTGFPTVYSHYCYYDAYGFYVCSPYSASFGAYCDPFDPFYSRYCYPYVSTYYPTYVVNPGTVVYAAPSTGSACVDGTPSGMCSSDYPKYCFNGALIDKATMCGCPAGQTQDPNNRNRCIAQTCSDGTALNACSSSRPQFCTSAGNLVDRPTQCGCPSGTKLEGGVCAPLNPICFVSSVTPSPVRAGENAAVAVSYSDVESASGYVSCGNGEVASLACSGGSTGTCIASCS